MITMLLTLGVVPAASFVIVPLSSDDRGRFVTLKKASSTSPLHMSDSWDNSAANGGGGGAAGRIEQIEFKIFPDGRVEETVRGMSLFIIMQRRGVTFDGDFLLACKHLVTDTIFFSFSRFCDLTPSSLFVFCTFLQRYQG